jgi:carbonic anhydrase/acetyltransferase-like protein (isoleucine patch superfamily)
VTRKYELSDTVISAGMLLHRIVAVRDFGFIKAGEIGGLVEGEENLSHDGNSWVRDNAVVYGGSIVSGDALVTGSAILHGNSAVSGNAFISDYAVISEMAHVFGGAFVLDRADVRGCAKVFGDTFIVDDALICGDAIVYNAIIGRGSMIDGLARVSGGKGIPRLYDVHLSSGAIVVH